MRPSCTMLLRGLYLGFERVLRGLWLVSTMLTSVMHWCVGRVLHDVTHACGRVTGCWFSGLCGVVRHMPSSSFGLRSLFFSLPLSLSSSLSLCMHACVLSLP